VTVKVRYGAAFPLPCRPERRDTWHANCVPGRDAFEQVIATIARFEKVTVCVPPSLFAGVQARLAASAPGARVLEMEMDDSWFRDTSPTFVRHKTSGQVAGVCWTFDSWGQYCYSDWAKDALVNSKICAIEGVPVISTGGMVLEGGSIHVDGTGTLLTTVQCLLKPNKADPPRVRNPGTPCSSFLPQGFSCFLLVFAPVVRPLLLYSLWLGSHHVLLVVGGRACTHFTTCCWQLEAELARTNRCVLRIHLSCLCLPDDVVPGHTKRHVASGS
jgi:hypothetical protein